MLFEPLLFVSKLVVSRGPEVAYEATFQRGINILAGENSSGKSTILAFLVYGLGADVSEWSEHAKLCDEVTVEVSLNGYPAVLSRPISDKAGQPMEVFTGTLEEARSAPRSAWQRFPYRSYESKLSFSQQLFGMLGLPELQTEVSGKITMHQLLRVHYSDQLSSVEHIFRDEVFDSPALRQAVGRLLFGAYDNEIYRNQLRLKDLNARLDAVAATLKNIYALFTGDTPLTLDWTRAQESNLNQRLQRLNADIVEQEVQNSSGDQGLSLTPLHEAVQQVQAVQSEIVKVDAELQGLQLEAADSAIYIRTLEEKLSHIEDSTEVASEVEEVRFTQCPSCFAEVARSETTTGCHLCKEPFDEERLRGRMLRQLASIRKQLRQSRELQEERSREIRLLDSRRHVLREQWVRAASQVRALQSRPTSAGQDQLRRLYEEVGRLQQEKKELAKHADLVQKVERLISEKAAISEEIAKIDNTNEQLLAAEQDRLLKSASIIASETMWFLHQDLPRQDTFQEASSVNFSFEKDRISVNGVQYFSASSKVYLKNSFLAGFLFAATKMQSFRHLRFLVLDTIEDKGMEQERSQNFQRLLVKRSLETDVEHQVIFATAMIDPSLDEDQFVVGRKSTHLNRTLKIG